MKNLLIILILLCGFQGYSQVKVGNLLIRSTYDTINPLVLDTIVWNDLTFPANRTRVNPTTQKPDYDDTNIGLLFPDNDTTELISFSFQTPHTMPDSAKYHIFLSPHVHWIQTSSLQAHFIIKYRIYDIGKPVPTTWIIDTLSVGVIPYTSGTIQQLTNGAEIDLGAYSGISTQVDLFFYRSTTDPLSGDALVKQFDIHYPIDRLGNLADY